MVRTRRLDYWIEERKLKHVDFIKLDVEGAELDVLKGAAATLQRHPRPVILAEIQDVRTAPWGYRAKDILNLLQGAGYSWSRILPDGLLDDLDVAAEAFEGNFVACPRESVGSLNTSLCQTS